MHLICAVSGVSLALPMELIERAVGADDTADDGIHLDAASFFNLDNDGKRRLVGLLFSTAGSLPLTLLVDEIQGIVDIASLRRFEKMPFLNKHGYREVSFFSVRNGRLLLVIDSNMLQVKVEAEASGL